jgi:hypothetical protein
MLLLSGLLCPSDLPHFSTFVPTFDTHAGRDFLDQGEKLKLQDSLEKSAPRNENRFRKKIMSDPELRFTWKNVAYSRGVSAHMIDFQDIPISPARNGIPEELFHGVSEILLRSP